MPLTDAQKQAAITPRFTAAAKKPLAQFLLKLDVGTLHAMDQSLGAANFTKLINAFYPDQLKSIKRDLTAAELTQLAAMNAATLNSLGSVSADWVKSMLRVIAHTAPVAFAQVGAGPIPAALGYVLNANNRIDQTSSQPTLLNTCVTELNLGGNATRNLIFSVSGNCVAEVNFDNHGGTAVSGHAHVYPVMCVPLTGHHAMGTPHVDMANYPATWRQLPAGVNPNTALGT